MSEIQEYYEMIENIINEELYIGASEDNLNDEIEHNMFCIQISCNLQNILSEEDILCSIERIVSNRRQQITASNASHGMSFYLWFDEQACQLRLNVISNFHKRLPFGCEYQILKNPLSIVKSFLYSEYHNGIPIGDCQSDGQETILSVYLKRLP